MAQAMDCGPNMNQNTTCGCRLVVSPFCKGPVVPLQAVEKLARLEEVGGVFQQAGDVREEGQVQGGNGSCRRGRGNRGAAATAVARVEHAAAPAAALILVHIAAAAAAAAAVRLLLLSLLPRACRE